MTILHLLPSLNYTAAGRQVSLLAPIFRSSSNLDIHVATLGRDGPFAEPLQRASVPIHALNSRPQVDPSAWWRLRRLVAQLRPAIIHAWRLPALRAAGLLRRLGRSEFKLIVSEPRRGGRINAFDRWLVRSSDTVIASDSFESAALRDLGIRAEHIHELPLAVAPPPSNPPPLTTSLPPATKRIMCIGALTPTHAFRDAIWAVDLMRYNVEGVRLAMIGNGPERARLERFAFGINRAAPNVDFIPARPDAAALLAHADVVWVPSRSECGRQVLLEAQAAGRPVIASALPGLAALIVDGQTGILVPSGDPFEFARATRTLFEDPAQAERIGAAARDAVAQRTPDRVAAKYAALYTG